MRWILFIQTRCYTNLVGEALSQPELSDLTAALLNSVAHTRSVLAIQVTDQVFAVELIELPGLIANGVDYIPVA